MVYVRVDGNVQIGMGHVMRTLSLADAMRKVGLPIYFLMSNQKGEGETAAELVRQRGFDVIEIPYAYQEKDGEIPYLARTLAQFPTVFLVDSYAVTPEYLSALRELGKVVYVDDLCEETYPIDGILNYNIYAENLPYQERYAENKSLQEKATKLFLGPQYAPIREAFVERRSAMEKEGKQKNGGQPLNVLFTTGGGDSLHILPAIAEDLDKLLDGVTYHFLCGPLSEDGEKLTSMAQMYGPKRMVVHGPQENMASFLNRFDLVVSAAGSTLYELCTLGIATIGFSFVENQVQNLAGFAQQVGMPTAGAFDQDMEKAKEKVFMLVREYLQEDEKRQNLANRMASLVDGMGAMRFAQEMKRIHEETRHS